MSIRKNSFLAAICLLIGITLWLAGLSLSDGKLAERLGSQVLRFHVIADSNRDFDQELKLSVRSFLLGRIYEEVGEGGSKEDIVSFLETDGSALMEETGRFIQSQGGDYDARLEIGKSYFPTKVYGDMVFPAGNYDAVKVVLGHGKGRNWWCVLYPSLCFLDESHGIVSEEKKEDLREVLTEEEFLTILNDPEKRDQVKIGFKWF